MRISDWSSDVCSSDLVDAAVQHDPGHRVDRTVVAQGRTGAGHAGEIDRRGRVHERQRYEHREAGVPLLEVLLLAPGKDPQVLHPGARVVDVDVTHRRDGPAANAVRGGER